MALRFHPDPGTILICDYSTGFRPPEMVKRRPVVVVSPRLRRRDGLVAVVPLSTSEPMPLMPYHAIIELAVPLPRPFSSPRMWAKADMVATVTFGRLDRFRVRTSEGRSYESRALSPPQFAAVRRAVLHGLGFDALTGHI